jgi:hypothetical protein
MVVGGSSIPNEQTEPPSHLPDEPVGDSLTWSGRVVCLSGQITRSVPSWR